ncbi:hypothetical protein [Sphingosinicella rhizophila]|uniref:Lipocalin-like domain-containing protein n=1 Tax=Sphingosinicella rhizophila TaxID=3050082 RepID=A0ABU3Q630_9SPHN|nr:hypothetical protein [Sphingosinicella sp. GR2756]MDT9598868.1 hypothetical protein [Sphingosinicella sp. GR2756]
MRVRTSLIASLAALVAASSPVHAANDPFIGTWTLDVAKSTFTPGPAPKSKILVFEPTADGMVIKEWEETPSGEMLYFTIPYSFGKPVPQTAIPAYDMLTVDRIDDRTNVGTIELRDRIIGHLLSTVSADGKTLILKSRIRLSDGSERSQMSVFSRR